MNYNTDYAIKEKHEDLLGRAYFSEQLGEAIFDYEGKESLVIGLYGKWGTGKTSVVNMALQKVELLSEKDTKNNIIIRFTPWNYSDQDNLILQFFNAIKARLENVEDGELKKKLGKALSDYSGVFEAASLIPVVGGVLSSVLKNVSQSVGNQLSQSIDLESAKVQLEKALGEANLKIIVFIDDIDRLTNSQIRSIFQLVKQVGDLPNIIYILAMDRGVVSRALEEVHNSDGNEYLEKIIQIPFEIPKLQITKLQNIFVDKLNYFINNLFEDIRWDDNYLNMVVENCVWPYLYTLRDVNRVINTFQFRYSMLYEETSFEDMLAITTLEVLEPSLYRWIAENKMTVCNETSYYLPNSSLKGDELRTKFEGIFSKLGINSSRAIKAISTIFPSFAKHINYNQYDDNLEFNARKQMRVAQLERFDLYFCLDVELIKVPRSFINSYIYTFDEEKLYKEFLDINANGNIGYFIDEILSLIETIPEDRLKIIATLFLKIKFCIKEDKNNIILNLSTKNKARLCAKKMILKLEESDRFIILEKVLMNSEIYALGTVASEIRGIERAYGIIPNGYNVDNQIISEEHLKELENKFLEKISEITIDDKTTEIDDFLQIVYLWKHLDINSAWDFLKKLFSNEIYKLKFFCLFAGNWHGTSESGWTFNQDNYKEFFFDKEIFELILRMDKSKLNNFSKKNQNMLATFYLNYENGDMEYANENKANELLERWKNL